MPSVFGSKNLDISTVPLMDSSVWDAFGRTRSHLASPTMSAELNRGSPIVRVSSSRTRRIRGGQERCWN